MGEFSVSGRGWRGQHGRKPPVFLNHPNPNPTPSPKACPKPKAVSALAPRKAGAAKKGKLKQQAAQVLMGDKKTTGGARGSSEREAVGWCTPTTHTCLRGALPPVDLRAVCLVRACSTQMRTWHRGAGRGEAGEGKKQQPNQQGAKRTRGREAGFRHRARQERTGGVRTRQLVTTDTQLAEPHGRGRQVAGKGSEDSGEGVGGRRRTLGKPL